MFATYLHSLLFCAVFLPFLIISTLDSHYKILNRLLKNIVRTGWVSSVNAEERTARVIFEDKRETIVSRDLKTVANQPVITVENWVDGAKWSYDAQYSSVPRDLEPGESYVKTAPDSPDVITTEKSIHYKCPLHGADETKHHKTVVKVYPWIPYVGQFVLCLYIPRDDATGT